MIGMTLTFTKQYQAGTDEMNNAITSTVDMEVDNVLIAPISDPTNVRQENMMAQTLIQLRVHLPKTFDSDISDSDFIWDNKKFHIDSDSVTFMPANTPGQWNRYFDAWIVENNVSMGNHLIDGFITEDGTGFFMSENNYYYLAQEMVI
jgi:hypothetical protein